MDKNYLQLQEEIARLRGEVERVKGMASQNSLLSVSTFNRPSIFSDRLRVPVFDAAPTVAEIGDLIAVGGKLYICTTASVSGAGAVFTVVGTQS